MAYIRYLIPPMRKSSPYPNTFNTFSCTAEYLFFSSFVKDWNKLDPDIRDCSNSVVRPKSESQNSSNKKTKCAKFFENKHFLPLIRTRTCVVSIGKKYSFFREFVVFCFLDNSVLGFAFLRYYVRIIAYFAKLYWNLSNLLKRKLTILITLWELSY